MSYTFALADNVNTNYSDSAYQTVSTVADSGKCGDNLKWELDTNGTITISGTGEMSRICVSNIATSIHRRRKRAIYART